LIGAVWITGIPGPKGKETFLNQSFASVTKLVKMKGWHGSLHDVKPPAGKTVLIGGESEKEIQCKILALKIEKELPCPQTVIDPGERWWHDTSVVWQNRFERFFKGHDDFSIRVKFECGLTVMPP
jgi:hypothetical protein